MNRRWALLTILLSMLFFTACTSSPSGRYTVSDDGAPPSVIGPEDVLDAVPRADPILSSGNKSPYKINGVTYEVMQNTSAYRERGIASWYGTKFHGHETSNGEIYDLYRATAAHKTLPIPSYVRVTHIANGRSVVARVNDRGPFHPDRVIDLSYAAAVKLGYMAQGTAEVEIELIKVEGVEDRRGSPGGDYRYLQVGAFGHQPSAQRLHAELAAFLTFPVNINTVNSDQGSLYRVRVGPIADHEALAQVQRQLEQMGYNSVQPLP
jgi:rare lipoprotein A